MDSYLYQRLLGKVIRQVRQDNKISQVELSRRTATAQSTICYIERGDKSITIDTLLRICKGLSIDIADLFKIVDCRWKDKTNF